LRDLSRRLQKALLPRTAPAVPGYDVAAGTALDGDGFGSSIWDWFTLSDGSPALVTLSVNPGDFPAAHALAIVRAFLREQSDEDGDLETLLQRVNTAVSRTFVTGTQGPVDCGVLVLGPERTTWLGAGAVHGGVLHRDGRMQEFSSCGPPLGLLDGFRYGAVDVTFQTADVIVALSHGARGLFRGAADVVSDLHGKPAGDVVSRLQSALQKAQGQGRGEHSVLFVRKN
jgi:sigma-B regulation protein RsbU (phosphoserine phosphatase)